MQKSYVAKTVINFIDFDFYVRPGDLLVHDSSNHNRLTVYRGGQIVKVVKQDPIGIVAFLKNKFIEPVPPSPAVITLVDAPTVIPEPVTAPVPPVEAPKVLPSKRDKAHAQEVPIEGYHKRVGLEQA